MILMQRKINGVSLQLLAWLMPAHQDLRVARTTGQRHGHTRTRFFLWTLSLCHSQRAVGCSRPTPCSQDVGSGPSPEGMMGGRYAEWGWRLHLGTQSARTFGPSACQSTVLGHCAVCKQSWEPQSFIERKRERKVGGGGWGVSYSLFLTSLFRGNNSPVN